MECEEGVSILTKKRPQISSLRDADLALLEDLKESMPQNVYQRCKFIIEENKRVLNSVTALKNKDLPLFGKLLCEGHKGLSEHYEIGCPETDFLVDFSKRFDGVLGARQMGGGFGGCTINIVHEDILENFVTEIENAYKRAYGIQLSPFEAIIDDGTKLL